MSLKAAYGHGVRMGVLAKANATQKDHRVVWFSSPWWLPSRLHRFAWRQGLKHGQGAHDLVSIITNLIIGDPK